MKRKLKGYICTTDLQDIMLGASDVKIFPTITKLKMNRSCWSECGIIEIDLTRYKVIKKGYSLW